MQKYPCRAGAKKYNPRTQAALMTPEEVQRLKAAIHKKLPPSFTKTLLQRQWQPLKTLKKQYGLQLLEHVSPEIAFFLPLQTTGIATGRPRQIKSCVGRGLSLPLLTHPSTRLTRVVS